MKYLCLGYFDAKKMDALPKPEIDAIMCECQPHLERLYDSGHLIIDAGLDQEITSLQRVNGKLKITVGPFVEISEVIGSAFIIDAQDMEEAIRIASLHPTTQMSAGEQLGWGIEIRPIHYFEKRELEG